MDNQHRKIDGYRELGPDEIDAMNQLKKKEADMLEFFESLNKEPNNTRSMALAKTNLQQAFMWAIRSIARPNGE